MQPVEISFDFDNYVKWSIRADEKMETIAIMIEQDKMMIFIKTSITEKNEK